MQSKYIFQILAITKSYNVLLTLHTNMSPLKWKDTLSHVSGYLHTFIFFFLILQGVSLICLTVVIYRKCKHKPSACLIEILMNNEVKVSKSSLRPFRSKHCYLLVNFKN